VHATLIEKYEKPRLVGHISRDATAINAREKAAKKEKKAAVTAPPKKRRRQKGEAANKPETRLERQQKMSWQRCWRSCPAFVIVVPSATAKDIPVTGWVTNCI
jgi:hypothetical protein